MCLEPRRDIGIRHIYQQPKRLPDHALGRQPPGPGRLMPVSLSSRHGGLLVARRSTNAFLDMDREADRAHSASFTSENHLSFIEISASKNSHAQISSSKLF
jgi:hypothetical protein